MSDPEKRICRYFNTLGGCWYGDSCKFLHIPDKRPPCKFFGLNQRSSTGCRFGESCHFSHDRTPFKSVENCANPSVELMKEVFKENVDPSGLSGTNNNNMTQTSSRLLNTAQDNMIQTPAANSSSYNTSRNLCTEVSNDGDNVMDGGTHCDQHTFLSTHESGVICAPDSDEILNKHAAAAHCASGDTVLAEGAPSSNMASSSASNTMAIIDSDMITTAQRASHEQIIQPADSMSYTAKEDGQSYAITPVTGRPNNMPTEIDIYCGSCKRILERRSNESYCTLLKDHYLECFLEKEGDHVKYVKTKAALEPGQMYWCKSCILIFEKPWSLFQHMADKAKGSKVQRWEKKIHLDWMDSVAGLMAGYDLGLFSPAKLRIDLRNLLADQHTMEEEMEAAAVTAAAMMQWLAPLSSPWRLQQREMMRKIEQLNRQMLRRANFSIAGNANNGPYGTRVAINAPPNSTLSHSSVCKETSKTISETNPTVFTQRNAELTTLENQDISESSSRSNNEELNNQTVVSLQTPSENACTREVSYVGLVNDRDSQSISPNEDHQNVAESLNTSIASKDVFLANNETVITKVNTENMVETNNINNISNRLPCNSAQGDNIFKKVDSRRPYSSAPAFGYSFSKGYNSSAISHGGRGNNDANRHSINPRISRQLASGLSNGGTRGGLHRGTRFLNGANVPPVRASSGFNPPSFHASMDFNCGFTDDEVEELLSQGIRPWDSEAAAALAVLRGELDHLLD